MTGRIESGRRYQAKEKQNFNSLLNWCWDIRSKPNAEEKTGSSKKVASPCSSWTKLPLFLRL